jgi:hypothetical protein
MAERVAEVRYNTTVVKRLRQILWKALTSVPGGRMLT